MRIEPPPGVDDAYARRAVEGTTIDVDSGGRSVRIRSDYSGVPRRGLWSWDRRLPRVHYEIRAPRQLDLDLDIDRSDTTVIGFEGRLVLDLNRSDLEARDLAGTITLDLDRGQLQASDLTGRITLDLDRGGRVVLERVRGSLHLDVDQTNIMVRDLRIDDDSDVDIDRGDLDLELDAAQALTIDADLSRRADFSSNLTVMMQQSGRRIHGTINGDGPRLRIVADRSEVRLRTP